MRISFCTIAWRRESGRLSEYIPRIAMLGYDGVEIWGNHLVGEDPHRIREALQENELEAAIISPYFDFTGATSEWHASIADVRHFVNCAAILDAPLIRVFTGTLGSEAASSEQRRACVNGLKLAAEIASDNGISLVLETHPATLTDRINSALELIAAVDADNLGLNLDIYHFWEIYKDPVDILEQLYPHVWHVHAKNARLAPRDQEAAVHPFHHAKRGMQDFTGITYLQDGLMDYAPFLMALHKKAYAGYVSVEWFGGHAWEAARHELEFLRATMAQVHSATVLPLGVWPSSKEEAEIHQDNPERQ